MKRYAALLLLPLFLAACDDDDEGPSRGTFEADVSGDVDASFSGPAVFGTDDVEGFGEVFGIGMVNVGASHAITILRPDTTLPEEGTYTLTINDALDPDQWTAFYLTGVSGTLESSFVSTEGTLTLTSVSSSRIVGSFEFTGEEVDPLTSDTAVVTVTGSFDAVAESSLPVLSVVPSGIARKR